MSSTVLDTQLLSTCEFQHLYNQCHFSVMILSSLPPGRSSMLLHWLNIKHTALSHHPFIRLAPICSCCSICASAHPGPGKAAGQRPIYSMQLRWSEHDPCHLTLMMDNKTHYSVLQWQPATSKKKKVFARVKTGVFSGIYRPMRAVSNQSTLATCALRNGKI